MNNEPLGLIDDLIGQADGPGRTQHYASLTIDPFPDPSAWDPQRQPDPDPEAQTGVYQTVPQVLGRLLRSWIGQCRFDPGLLAPKPAGSIHRFMLKPSRKSSRPGIGGPSPGKVKAAELATGGLGGFLGFVDKSFRDHDYQLGRRNCQRFLMKQFVRRHNDPLFAGWKPGPNQQDLYVNDPKEPGDPNARYLPILPLLNASLRAEIPVHSWPSMSMEKWRRVRKRIAKRLAKAGQRLMVEEFGSFKGAVGWGAVATFARPVKRATDRIDEALTDREQLP